MNALYDMGYISESFVIKEAGFFIDECDMFPLRIQDNLAVGTTKKIAEKLRGEYGCVISTRLHTVRTCRILYHVTCLY